MATAPLQELRAQRPIFSARQALCGSVCLACAQLPHYPGSVMECLQRSPAVRQAFYLPFPLEHVTIFAEMIAAYCSYTTC